MKSREELLLDSQELLVGFIHTELELGGTFVRSAISAGVRDREHFDHAKASATRAAGAVRHFMERVHDVRVRAEITHRVEELEAEIAGL